MGPNINMDVKYRKNKNKKKSVKRYSLVNYEILFESATRAYSDKRPDLANRYVQLAKKISMRNKVPIPKRYRLLFCKHCLSFLMPSQNSRVRLNNGKLVYLCNRCKNFRRIPLKNNNRD